MQPGIRVKHGRYYYVRKHKWTALTRVDKGEIALLEAYYALTRDDPKTMASLLMAYLADGTEDLKAITRLKYRQAIVSMLIPVFGKMPMGTLEPGHVSQFLEKRKRAGAAVAGNREKAVLSSACSFGMRQGWLRFNPCYGTRRNKERPSARYVEHTELVTQLDRAPPELYPLIGSGYLTGMRQTDLRKLKRTNLTVRGIEYTESKTGKRRLVEWTPTLRKLVTMALERSKGEHVFTSARGKPWSQWGLQSAMRRFKPGFRFRDLRPKAETDAPGTLGHTGQMQSRYTRRQTVKPVK